MTFGLEYLFIFGKFCDSHYTSRFSSLTGEICLQKYLPISGQLSITNQLKQNVIDYQNHLTIEETWRKKVIILKTSTTPRKKTLGTRREVINAGTLPWNVFIAAQENWKWSDNVFTSQREMWSLQWINDHLLLLIHSFFFVGNATISR